MKAGVKSLSNYQKKSLSNRGFFCRFAFVCVLFFRLYLKMLLGKLLQTIAISNSHSIKIEIYETNMIKDVGHTKA